jgi:hypothetical protein
MAITGDQAVGVGHARQRDQVVVVGVWRETGLRGRGIDDQRVLGEPGDELGCGGGADPAAEPRAVEDIAKLLEQRRTCDELEATVHELLDWEFQMLLFALVRTVRRDDRLSVRAPDPHARLRRRPRCHRATACRCSSGSPTGTRRS